MCVHEGHGCSHLSLKALELCQENGIHIQVVLWQLHTSHRVHIRVVLWQLHTSHRVQMEDLTHFQEFKPPLCVQVASKLTWKALAEVRERDTMFSAMLGNEDLKDCALEP